MIRRLSTNEDMIQAYALIINVFNICHSNTTTDEAKKCFYEGNTVDQFIVGNKNNSIKCWGYFEKGVLCGVAELQDDNHFINLFILPEYQKRGIGRKLFDVVIDECRKVGACEAVRIEALLSSVEFLRRCGAEICNDKQTFSELEYIPMLFRM